MPYSDPAKARAAARERQRRYRRRQHKARYGPNAGDMRGRHGNHARGPENGRWNDDRLLSSHGYVLVRVGKGHPLAFGNGYAYEHDLVWTAAHGPLKPGETVHHKRCGAKTDNRLANLEKLTRSAHGRHHSRERDRDAFGRFL